MDRRNPELSVVTNRIFVSQPAQVCPWAAQIRSSAIQNGTPNPPLDCDSVIGRDYRRSHSGVRCSHGAVDDGVESTLGTGNGPHHPSGCFARTRPIPAGVSDDPAQAKFEGATLLAQP